MHPYRVVGISEMLETPKRAPKKGLKGYLLIEFRKGVLLVRLRFKVLLCSSGRMIQIWASGARTSNGNQVRENRVEIGEGVSESQLFEAMAEHVSAKEKIPIASITFRWEKLI